MTGKVICIILGILSILAIIGCIIFLINADVRLTQDVTGNLNRASYGRDAGEIEGYLTLYVDEVERRGWDKYYTGYVYKTPDNQVGLHIKAVKNLIVRAQELNAIDHADMAYQVGMTDLNAAVVKVSEAMHGRYFYRFYGGATMWWVMSILALLCIGLWVGVAICSEYY